MKIKKIESDEPKRIACYSPSGFLVDVLESHGFSVNSLECYGHSKKDFRLDISIIADGDAFTDMLKVRLDHFI